MRVPHSRQRNSRAALRGGEISGALGFVARADLDRQISELHMSGDFADLHSYTLKRLDHDVTSLTDCRIGVVPHEWLRAMFDYYDRHGLPVGTLPMRAVLSPPPSPIERSWSRSRSHAAR